MSSLASDLGQAAAELRLAFDQSFARPPLQQRDGSEGLLVFGVAGDSYGMRVRELSGMVMPRKVVWLPTSCRDLLGIVAIRGAIVPVYSVAALLSYQQEDDARWLVTGGTGEPVGLAFSDFEGWLSVTRTESYVSGQTGVARECISEVARDGDRPLPIVSIPKIIDGIMARAASGRPTGKEQR